MGTLVIKPPTGIVSLIPATRSPDGSAQGWWNPVLASSNDAAILDGLTGTLNFICNELPPVTLARIELNWDAVSDIFSLDGGTDIAFSALPSGFLMNGDIVISAVWANTPNGPFSANILSSDLAQSLNISMEFVALATTGLPIVNPSPLVYITPSNFLAGIFTVQLAGASTTDAGLARFGLVGFVGAPFSLVGTYAIFATTWTMEGGPVGGPYHASPFHPGDEIIINSPNETPDLTDVTEIKLSYTDLGGNLITVVVPFTDFLEYTPKTAKFLLPITLPYNSILPFDFIPFNPTPFEPIIYNPAPPVITQIPITMVVQIVSTKFTGSILLGTFEILIADASGIYKITPDKTNDTLYSQNSLTTEDVAIPTPFVKTGFIGG